MNLRLKTHSYPGDVSKQKKEQMLERPKTPSEKRWRRVIRSKARAVLKERTKKIIEQETISP